MGKLWCKDLGCKRLVSNCTLRKMPLSGAALSAWLTQVAGTVITVRDLSNSFCDSLVPRTREIPYLIGKMGSYCKFPTAKQQCLELDCCQGYSNTSLKFGCHIYYAQHSVAIFFFFFISHSCRQAYSGRQSETNKRACKNRQLLIIVYPCILEWVLLTFLYDLFFPTQKMLFY